MTEPRKHNQDNDMTYMNTGNPQNADPKNAYFIADLDLRAEVNRLLDELRELAGKANRGGLPAEVEYHRTVATLFDIRPAITSEDARRQVASAKHLRRLAILVETSAVAPEMRSGPLRGAAQ